MPLPKSSTPFMNLSCFQSKRKSDTISSQRRKGSFIILESQDMKQCYGKVKNVLSSVSSRGVQKKSSTFDNTILECSWKIVGELIDVIVTCPDDGETVEVQINIDDIQPRK